MMVNDDDDDDDDGNEKEEGDDDDDDDNGDDDEEAKSQNEKHVRHATDLWVSVGWILRGPREPKGAMGREPRGAKGNGHRIRLSGFKLTRTGNPNKTQAQTKCFHTGMKHH